jgi:hypothetical protein
MVASYAEALEVLPRNAFVRGGGDRFGHFIFGPVQHLVADAFGPASHPNDAAVAAEGERIPHPAPWA